MKSENNLNLLFDLLEKTLEQGGIWTLADVQEFVAQEKMNIWTRDDAVALTSVEEHRDGNVLVIDLAGGSLNSLKDIEREIEKYARVQGFKYIYINGRKAWERALPDYKLHTVILRKELTYEGS